MKTNNDSVLHLIIRIPKAEAAFTYFQLESNEGLCFYSTLTESLKQFYRDIEIFAPIVFEKELRHIMDELGKLFSIDILTDEICPDKRGLAGKTEGSSC